MTEGDFKSFEAVGALVVVLHLDGRIAYWNGPCSELTGYSLGEVRGRGFWDFLLVPEEVDRVKDALAKLPSAEQPGGFANYFVGHDLRNPLGSIGLSVATVGRRGNLDDRDDETLGRILSSSQRMTRMISQLLDLTRARLGGGFPLEREMTDLGEVCRSVVGEFGAQIQVDVEADVRGSWDADRLAEAISNITGNALEHAAQGTTVVVKTYGVGAEVVVAISNQGNPIPPDVLPFIFEPFRRAKQLEKSATVGVARDVQGRRGEQADDGGADGGNECNEERDHREEDRMRHSTDEEASQRRHSLHARGDDGGHDDGERHLSELREKLARVSRPKGQGIVQPGYEVAALDEEEVERNQHHHGSEHHGAGRRQGSPDGDRSLPALGADLPFQHLVDVSWAARRPRGQGASLFEAGAPPANPFGPPGLQVSRRLGQVRSGSGMGRFVGTVGWLIRATKSWR